MRSIVVVVVALVPFVAGAQTAAAKYLPRGCRNRQCGDRARNQNSGTVAITPPRFAFATSSGVGMGTACAGSSVTGTLGETVTFARASSRTCLKGGETSGIANGDMVTLTSNQPATQYGGDGSGALGLSVWEARTNSTPRSQELDNAVWVRTGGTYVPTVVANAAVAPDGTTTAERVTFHSTDGATSSFIYQLNACGAAGPHALSFFVKGVSGSGTIPFSFSDAAPGWIAFTSCNYVSASWSRCVMEQVIFTNSVGTVLAIGSAAVEDGQAFATNDVYLWGVQCEVGATASPFIPTAAAAVDRAAEVASASYAAAGPSVSLSGNYTPAGRTQDYTATVSMAFDFSNETSLGIVGAKDRCDIRIVDTDNAKNAPGEFLTPASSLSSCSYGSGRTLCGGGYCKAVSGALTLPIGAATLYLGGQFDGGAANGTVKQLCADPTPGRCVAGQNITCPAAESSAVALVGDSIMVGAYEVKVLDEMNDKLCPVGRAAVNYAVAGASIEDCVTQYHTSVKGHAYAAVATNCGKNNLGDGVNAAAEYAKMESLLNDITLDGGFRVVLGNVTPCSGASACIGTANAVITSFNAKEADWCADAGPARATCINNYALLGADSRTVIFTPSRNTTLGNLCLPSSDGLHPNNYCTTKLADAFASAFLDGGG